MSKVFKYVLIAIAVVGAAAVLLVLVVVGWLSGASHKLDQKYARLKADYGYITQPADLQLRSITKSGDPLDSPQEEGWQYTYTSTASNEQVRDEVVKALNNAGYTADPESVQNPNTGKVTGYTIAAISSSAGTRVKFTIDTAYTIYASIVESN